MATVTPTPLLQLDNLVKTYGAVQAVRGISFSADGGEIVAVVGENGAGKSTVMKILAGIERADSGQVLIDGCLAELGSPAQARALGVSIVPQELTLCLDMTVRDNILLGDYPLLRAGVVDRAAVEKEAVQRLEFLGTPGVNTSVLVRHLTFVEQAFVQIARAIRHDTRLLIMDEPTAPMSQVEVDQLLDVLRNLASRGIAIIYISHRLEEVTQLASRAVVLRDGQVAKELDGAHLTLRELVSSMMGEATISEKDRPVRRESGEIVLSVEHVTGSTLHDVSFDLRSGEIAAVYGVLGSGFEELGRSIVEARTLPGGRVSIIGQTIARGDIPSAVGLGLGYVPPERRTQGLHLQGSVANNISMGMLGLVTRLGVIRTKLMSGIVKRWITELSIKTPSEDASVGTLSGGSQQKVLVARWMAAGSMVLLLEEPTRGVDVATKHELYDAFRKEAGNGKAILIISSDLEEIEEIADRVLVIRGGEIVARLDKVDRHQIAEAALSTIDSVNPIT